MPASGCLLLGRARRDPGRAGDAEPSLQVASPRAAGDGAGSGASRRPCRLDLAQHLGGGGAMGRQLAAGDADQAGPRPQRRVAAHRRRRQVRLARRHDDRAQPGEGRERLRGIEAQLRERQAQRLDQVVGLGRRDRRRHVGDRMVDVGRADQHRAFPDVGEHRAAIARMQPGEAALQRHGLAREHEMAAAQRPQHRRARRRAGPDAGGMHGHGRRHLGARAVEPVFEARAGDAAAALRSAWPRHG